MSDKLEAIIQELEPRLPPLGLDKTIRVDLKDEGCIYIDGEKASISDADAECVLTTSLTTFQGVLDGNVYPATAVAVGKIKVKGDFGVAIKFSYVYNH